MYVKIKTDGSLYNMPDVYKASWDLRNDDTTRVFCANHDEWLQKKDTEPPEYNPETQYLTFHYEQEGSFAVQVWEVHDIENIEDTVE